MDEWEKLQRCKRSWEAQARLMEFEDRRRRRVGFRRGWWRRVLAVVAGALILASMAGNESVLGMLFLGPEARLPYLSQFLLDPPRGLIAMLLLLVLLPSRFHPEDMLEEEARLCWRLYGTLPDGVPGPDLSELEPSFLAASRGLREMLEAACLEGRGREFARGWAEQVEWRLEQEANRRSWRASCWMVGLGMLSNHVIFLAAVAPLVGYLTPHSCVAVCLPRGA